MEIILALIAILFFGTLALCAIAAIFAAAYVGALVFTVYLLPRLLLHTGVFTLHAAGTALFFSLAALREITGQAARGVAIWEGQPRWQQTAQERVRAAQNTLPIETWHAACALLGLPIDGFDRQALSRAYRKAIITAHPDRGGDPAQATAINVARDLIRRHQGWT